ncbi:hypothetical protein M7I_5615 [Glarea lozoyensis 74030]|uniref:Uncharacterized protein n=1 Tax=Glarea lozoyensis (strain ATCC 74030 / MF5533) TaxID=1104152 RepID=H0ESD6_GLAL7|nr:hypothetical protein M7I_5615 [Glarea lozoyensis 74030]
MSEDSPWAMQIHEHLLSKVSTSKSKTEKLLREDDENEESKDEAERWLSEFDETY